MSLFCGGLVWVLDRAWRIGSLIFNPQPCVRVRKWPISCVWTWSCCWSIFLIVPLANSSNPATNRQQRWLLGMYVTGMGVTGTGLFSGGDTCGCTDPLAFNWFRVPAYGCNDAWRHWEVEVIPAQERQGWGTGTTFQISGYIIWVRYNNLTATSLEQCLVGITIPKIAELFRFGESCNLSRNISEDHRRWV